MVMVVMVGEETAAVVVVMVVVRATERAAASLVVGASVQVTMVGTRVAVMPRPRNVQTMKMVANQPGCGSGEKSPNPMVVKVTIVK